MTIMDREIFENFQRFLRAERGLANTTVATYAHHARAYLIFLAKIGVAAASSTAQAVLAYFEGLRSRGLRSCTLFCATIAIRTFHRFLVDKGYATSDSSSGLPLPKLSSRIPEPLSAKEVDALMLAPSAYRFSGIRDRAILEVLFCGLRSCCFKFSWGDDIVNLITALCSTGRICDVNGRKTRDFKSLGKANC